MFRPFGGRRALDPCLAGLVLAVSACASAARSEAPVAAPKPVAAPRRGAAPPPVAAKPADSATPRRARTGAAAAAKRKPIVRVDSTALEFAVTARFAHLPLAQALAKRTRNPEAAERAAWAVTREAGRLRVSPSLIAAVLLIENRALDSGAVSSQGAIGMMQVMPIHAGSYGCASSDLKSLDANICHGARILHMYIARSGSVSRALRRYNGCVRGSNTSGCSRYPARVLRTAARIRREMLASSGAPVSAPERKRPEPRRQPAALAIATE